jgi:sn-glycerol 3-phosphate transport system substrate-binding protein
MTAALGEEVARIVAGFNASQSAVEVEAVYKGGYADTLNAAIAASRAGQAPHLLQVFEVGTGTMMAAGKAVKQVWELAKETGLTIDPKAYVPAVRGYYSLSDGRMASMPFNSSTAVMWYNKDAFRKAGLDPDKAPATWQEVRAAAEAIKAKNAAPVAMTTSWPTWIQIEQYGALHNLPFSTKGNGFDGLDTELKFNDKAHAKHIQRLVDMAKDGTFKYAGRDSAPDPLIVSGEAAISFGSSAARGNLVKNAKFEFGEAYLPFDPELIKTPLNSIIGGASLWTMTAPGRTPAEYKAVAELLKYMAKPEVDAVWSQNTGYVPVTLAGFEASKAAGYYAKNPGTDLPVEQLARGTMTPNTKGLRLGRLPEIRNIIQEELEKALQGGQTVQAALDNAVTRGDKVLKEFAKTAKANWT